MIRKMRLAAIVLGLSGFAVACGGEAGSSIAGPSASTASTGSGGGNGNGGLRVQCEQRSGRSNVSVDGNNLRPGTYGARIASGANSATAPARVSVGDEVEFDFDSNINDVAAGATSIAASFIQNGQVTGTLLDASGAEVATATAGCSAR